MSLPNTLSHNVWVLNVKSVGRQIFEENFIMFYDLSLDDPTLSYQNQQQRQQYLKIPKRYSITIKVWPFMSLKST